MRLPPALVLVLAVLLVLVAGLADRALVGRADALREAAILRSPSAGGTPRRSAELS